MTTPILSSVQAKRSLERIRTHLSPILLERLQKVADLLSDATLRTTAAKVQHALFAGTSPEAATKSMQRLRIDLTEAAREAGVELKLCISEARSVGAERREVWFEGERPPLDGLNRTEELERVGEALIVDVQGTPLGNVEPRLQLAERRDGKPLVRVFISYARGDGDLPNKLAEDLKPRLGSSSKYEFEEWQDIELMPGEDWDRTIRAAMGRAHLGLLLLSPHFFASKYIGNVEIPAFVSGRGQGLVGKRVIPVELEQLDLTHTDMRGLAVHQVFRGPKHHKSPFPRRKSAKRTAWMNALVKAIHEILDQHADIEPIPPPAPPPCDRFLRAEFMLSPDLEGIERYLIEDTLAQATRLDTSLLDRPAEATPASVQAVGYIMDWLRDESGPALFALLGEYGMGKTITCQRVVRTIERRNSDGESLPSPLYFDLRRLTSLRGRDQVPRLNEVIDECIERGWSVVGAKPSAKDLLEQASQQPMVFVFDGLDEALVHLSEAHGREFTRELLRVRELGEGTGFRTRVLLSCRTHFFRTLQEQDSHFTGHDRGLTTAKDYAALVLLPLGPEQVRRYLERALPEINVGRASELVRSVHNLEELAARPYTLQLISEQIPKIEELRARGETVRGVTLYRLMVEKWLNRDGGKHHIKPDHKRKLMSYLAAWTWSRGTRFVPATELEDWFGAWLEGDPAMRRRYTEVGFDKLEEDLRTATFLVREDDPTGQALGFRFAHTSIQEFFLSCFLFDALVDDAPERWTFEDVSRETWNFFMQHIVERGGGDLVTRMSTWALGERREVRWLVFRYVIEGHRRDWPMPIVRGIDLSDIQLQGCQLRGPLDLSGSIWARANLRQLRWQNITVDDACFDDADLRFLEWERVKAERASFERTQADGAVFRRVVWDGARGSGATGRRCSFIRTRPPGFWLDEAVVAPRMAPALAEERMVQISSLPRLLSLAWSPDGTHALLGGQDGMLRLWDVATGTSLASWEGHRGWVRSCAWSPDGKHALSGSDDGTLRLWDIATGMSLGVWERHRGRVLTCAWSPDGKRALSGDDNGTLVLWDVATGKCVRSWKRHRGWVTSCAWSPDGKRVMSGGQDQSLRLWDVVTGANVAVWKGHKDWIRCCAWSPDGKRVISGGDDGMLRLWDGTTGARMRVWEGHRDRVWSCAWSPDGKRALSSGTDGKLRLWNMATGASLGAWEGHRGGNTSCVWSPDGRRALSAGADGTLRLWDVATGASVGVWERHRGGVFSCAWSPDGRRVLSGGDERLIRMWDVATGANLARWKHEGWIASCVCWSPDGTRALSGGGDETLLLWDVPTGATVAVWKGHQGGVWACSWSPDGRQALSGDRGGTLRLWDVAKGTCVVWEGHQGSVQSCAWSPDGKQALSSATDGTLRLWDVATGANIRVWEVHANWVLACVWSPDGKRALTGSWDGTLRLWDVATGASMGLWNGHRSRVWSCAWSPDGKRVISGGGDGTLRLWDAATGANVEIWEGHRGDVRSCAWSPDGKRVISGGDDGTLRLWDVATGLSTLVMAVVNGGHASHIPGSYADGGRILEASEGAWRWLRWLVRHSNGATELLHAETFGELPPPRR